MTRSSYLLCLYVVFLSHEILLGASTGVHFQERDKGYTSIPVPRIPDNALSINLGMNQISNADWFPKFTSLENLVLDYNLFTQFPDVTNVSSTLVEIVLDYNNISTIAYDRLDILTSLEKLHLIGNWLLADDIPDAIGPSLTLIDVKLGRNRLDRIPNFKTLCLSVKTLDIDYNSISLIGEHDFDHMTNLVTLQLDGNTFSHIDNIPSFLTRLSAVRFGFNRLTEFPDLRNLSALSELFLEHNAISYIAGDRASGRSDVTHRAVPAGQPPHLRLHPGRPWTHRHAHRAHAQWQSHRHFPNMAAPGKKAN